MSYLARLVINAYSRTLDLYPRKFKDDFADEMRTVFRKSVLDSAEEGIRPFVLVCSREFIGMPFNILREFWHEFQEREITMVRENYSGSPATTGQVMMGALPFFLFGLIMIMFEVPLELYMSAWFTALGSILFALLLVLPAIGFGVGWVQSFPRWSYPYAGMALLLAYYIQSASTPGLNFFGIPIFGRELWGWRAWIPLAAAFVVALAVSRSFQPFIRFFTNLWKDWSIPSYLMAGALPLLVLIAFDEIDRLYSLYFMVVFAVLLVSMVVLYLRSRYTWQRALVLTIGILAIIYPAAVGSNSYWLAHNGMYLSGARHSLALAGKIALVMLFPAWLELLRQSLGRLRTTY